MWIRRTVIATFLILVASCMPGPQGFGGWRAPDLAVGTITALPVMTATATTEAASNTCRAPASGACAGCSVSCPSDRPAYCSSGLTDYRPTNTGHAPICQRAASCYCGR